MMLLCLGEGSRRNYFQIPLKFGRLVLLHDGPLYCRKVLKQIGVADLLPDETVGAVKEARLLSKVRDNSNIPSEITSLTHGYTATPSFDCKISRQFSGKGILLHCNRAL